MSTPLLKAINTYDYNMTMKLLETEDPCIYKKDELLGGEVNILPILQAMIKFEGSERVDIVRRCLERGASPTDKGRVTYWTSNAIEYGIKMGYIDIVRLFDCSGDVDYIDYALREGLDDSTLYTVNYEIRGFAKSLNNEVLRYLFSKYHWKKYEEYFVQACGHSLEAIKFIVKRSQLTEDMKSEGLKLCVEKKIGDGAIEYLLNLGVNYNRVYVSLRLIGEKDYLRDRLIEFYSGMKLDLDHSIIFLSIDDNIIFKKLLDLDTKLANARDDEFSTPLIKCAYRIRDHGIKYFLYMKELIQYGADINAYNKWGESAVNICASRGHLRELKIIIEQWGASLLPPAINNTNWKDPLSQAKKYDHEETITYLQKVYDERSIPI